MATRFSGGRSRSTRREPPTIGGWSYETSLTPQYLIEVPVPSHLRVMVIDFAAYDIYILFLNCSDSMVFFVFEFYYL